MKNKKAELIIQCLKEAPPGIVVEAGCIREETEVVEDGFSTPYIANECNEQGRWFFSFDTEGEHVAIANRVLLEMGFGPQVECMDAKVGIEKTCPTFGPIAFLFLDSHRHPAFTLDQFKAAHLCAGAVVIIDDAQPIDDYEFGKAQFIKEWRDFHKLPYEIVETHNNGQYQWSSMVFTVEEEKLPGNMK